MGSGCSRREGEEEGSRIYIRIEHGVSKDSERWEGGGGGCVDGDKLLGMKGLLYQ